MANYYLKVYKRYLLVLLTLMSFVMAFCDLSAGSSLKESQEAMFPAKSFSFDMEISRADGSLLEGKGISDGIGRFLIEFSKPDKMSQWRILAFDGEHSIFIPITAKVFDVSSRFQLPELGISIEDIIGVNLVNDCTSADEIEKNKDELQMLLFPIDKRLSYKRILAYLSLKTKKINKMEFFDSSGKNVKNWIFKYSENQEMEKEILYPNDTSKGGKVRIFNIIETNITPDMLSKTKLSEKNKIFD